MRWWKLGGFQGERERNASLAGNQMEENWDEANYLANIEILCYRASRSSYNCMPNT